MKISRLLFEVLNNASSSSGSLAVPTTLINQNIIDTYGDVTPYLLDEGYWELDTTLEDVTGEYAIYKLELQVSDTSDFSNILFNIGLGDSWDNLTITAWSNLSFEDWEALEVITSENWTEFHLSGWYYYDPENFTWNRVPSTGISSQYIDSEIKYISPESYYLSRNQLYYFRWRQTTNSDNSQWQVSQDIVWT